MQPPHQWCLTSLENKDLPILFLQMVNIRWFVGENGTNIWKSMLGYIFNY